MSSFARINKHTRDVLINRYCHVRWGLKAAWHHPLLAHLPRLQSVKLFSPKYQLGHSKKYLILRLKKNIFILSKYQQANTYFFQKQITSCNQQFGCSRCIGDIQLPPPPQLPNDHHQWFFLNRNVGQVTPKIIYFHDLKKHFLDQSILLNKLVKTHTSTIAQSTISQLYNNIRGQWFCI